MKKQWKRPYLEALEVKMTMSRWWPGRSKQDSGNDSDNDSKNDSHNDSCNLGFDS